MNTEPRLPATASPPPKHGARLRTLFPHNPHSPRSIRRDVLAGLSITGLLLPSTIAYADIAGLPPQAGLVSLLAGLVIYGLIGSSRFAIVSATSSSAAVLAAATLSAPDIAPYTFAAALVISTGVLFLLAGAARLGAIAYFISLPVLRGFSFGLALTIVILELPTVFGLTTHHHTALYLAFELAGQLARTNPYSTALGAVALIALFALERWKRLARVPATLLVIVLALAAGYWIAWSRYGIAVVGAINLEHISLSLPGMDRMQWMQSMELSFALMLILYAESYGSIRGFALKHGDAISTNRDLVALGCANLVSGLLHGTPVGAGYSATAANEAAGAQTRRAGLCAAAVVAFIIVVFPPLLARIPEPVLAAIVIFSVSHSLHPSVFKPYWTWRRDRLVVIAALLAVLTLGLLHGLLAAIGVSLLLTLRKLSEPKVCVLGRLRSSHDFVDTALHADAHPIDGLLIVRPETPLFFANTERVLGKVRALLDTQQDASREGHGIRAVMLSLEETPDLDGSAIEALRTFADECSARGQRLILARLKPAALRVLTRAANDTLRPDMFSELSVDECVQSLVQQPAPAHGG
ncbi:MAG: SulP family inorganic anion transporter [Burkholderiaceae bacterium]|jgi:MFS superfamily sulfate permease-like transporter|nr:SulP family inorganic anion transporter [Burkholderiaceae bacterium]